MSSKTFVIVVILLIAITAIAGLILFRKPTTKTPSTTFTQQQAAVSPVPTAVLPAGNSDQQLTQDSQSIDDSLNALDSDLNSVDQGLNDQETNLQ